MSEQAQEQRWHSYGIAGVARWDKRSGAWEPMTPQLANALESRVSEAEARAEAAEGERDELKRPMRELVDTWQERERRMRAEIARLTAERDVLAGKSAGAAKGRLGWVWKMAHEREEILERLTGYSGGKSSMPIEHAFVLAFDALTAQAAKGALADEAMPYVHYAWDHTYDRYYAPGELKGARDWLARYDALTPDAGKEEQDD